MYSPQRARGIVVGLAVINVLVFLALSPMAERAPLTAPNVIVAIILFALIVFTDFFDIELPLSSVRITVSVSSAICFAAALTLGPSIGAVIAGLGALTVELAQRRPALKLTVNVSNYMLATFLAGYVYSALADTSRSPIGTSSNLIVTVAASAVYTSVESGVMALVLSRVVGTSTWRMWRASAAGVLLEWVTLPTLGSLIPVLKEESLLALVIAVVPLIGPYLAFRSYRQIHDETRKTIELLADMLDRRDQYTSEHSKRVASYVEAILDEIDDISVEEAETIVEAARIHDLGKVSIADGTLNKPGKLTPEEVQLIQRHAPDGAEILSTLSMFRQAAILVRHHHERWDGKGYPDGLAGTAIPFGARVIAVADTYDAMTSDRSYRRALPHHVAMAEIRRSAGTQFDPDIVAAFERAMLAHPGDARATTLEPASHD